MKIKTILLATVLSAGSLLAQPGPPHGDGMRGPGANLDALKSVLELTDQQVTDLKAAQKTFFTDQVKPIMEQIREKREALRTEMQKESPNSSVVGQLQVEVADLAKQIQAKREAQAAQTRASLTDAQKAKLTQLEEAAKLLPAVHEAQALGLVSPPEGGPGFGFGARAGMMRAFGARAARARQ
jgi:Spy/CpxP family protein refolding chaperone